MAAIANDERRSLLPFRIVLPVFFAALLVRWIYALSLYAEVQAAGSAFASLAVKKGPERDVPPDQGQDGSANQSGGAPAS